MTREKSKWLNHEGESTDARNWGGSTRTSVEGPVMGLEQRGWVRLLRFVVQLKYVQEEINEFSKTVCHLERSSGEGV
jgi:hypothetical protein